jgi:hypothetical protein
MLDGILIELSNIMSCGDFPTTLSQSCHEVQSPENSLWSAAAAIASQVVSSTSNAKRHAAKEALRLHLKSVAPTEWSALSCVVLPWLNEQIRESRGNCGLVSAACAFVEEHAHRCSVAERTPCDDLSSPFHAAAHESSAVDGYALILSVAREVFPALLNSSPEHHFASMISQALPLLASSDVQERLIYIQVLRSCCCVAADYM